MTKHLYLIDLPVLMRLFSHCTINRLVLLLLMLPFLSPFVYRCPKHSQAYFKPSFATSKSRWCNVSFMKDALATVIRVEVKPIDSNKEKEGRCIGRSDQPRRVTTHPACPSVAQPPSLAHMVSCASHPAFPFISPRVQAVIRFCPLSMGVN